MRGILPPRSRLGAVLLLSAPLLAPGVWAAPRPAPAPPAAVAADAPPEATTHQLTHAGAVQILAGNYPRAAQLFGQAVGIDPDFTRAHLGLAIAALGSGDRREFDRAWRRVDALTHGAPEVRYILAVQKWTAGDVRVAEDEARGAARADNGFLEARYLLGMIEATRGDLTHAVSTLQDALHVDSTWAPVHLQLGAVLAASGDLEGALAEMRLALSLDAEIEPAGADPKVAFADRRVLLGTTHGSGLGLPLPVPRPLFLGPGPRQPLVTAQETTAVPEWYLDYAMAGFLEDNGDWGPATRLYEKGLTLNDRESLRTPVGGRLVDYLPHRHLARVCLETGDLREARLHLEIARNQAATPSESLHLLETLIGIATSRTRLVLQRLPDRTSADALPIRGLLITRDRPAWVDVGGQKALLRPATAEDLARFTEEPPAPAAESGIQTLYFEVPSYPLPDAGPCRIRIRPGTAESAGAEAEVLIVRDAKESAGGARPATEKTQPPAGGGGQ